LRQIINGAIIDHRLPLDLSTPQGVKHLYEFVRMLLVLYLLCGAPRLVRWQTARAETSSSKPADVNERLDNG
jgi:hypothetical protein